MKPETGPLFPPWRPGSDPDALSRVGIARGTTETIRQIERRCAISRQHGDLAFEFVLVLAILGWVLFAASIVARIVG